MRVLIAGCGYVGIALGAELRAQGHAVFGLRRTDAARAEMESAGIQPLWGDLTRPEDLARLPANYDWVVHCASASGGGPEDYRSIYLRGTRNLVEWIGISPPRKFVYTSSTSVYAQTDGSLVDEASATEPLTETGRVLVETEAFLLRAAQEGKLPAVVLRLAGIYGPARGYWLRQYLSGAAKMEGNGVRTMNMIHRQDAVGTIVAALQRGRPGEVYNVVDDEPVSQLDCFEWLSRELNRPMPVSVPEDRQSARKRGLTNKRVSNRKLKAEFDYVFRYPTFRDGYRAEIEAGQK